MKKPLISFDKITKTYITGPVEYQALKGVSFKIDKGEFVSIMGPSGSGKSTIMNIMGALDTPTTGKYKLRGKDISKYSEDELAGIRNKEVGFVFQSFNLLPRTTVLKNVIRPMMSAGIKKEEWENRAVEKLALVGLVDKMDNLSNHLSGGQIQRVAIARALVMNPSIVMADEPTGNLDTKTAEEIMTTLSRLNKQGTTVVVITHEENIAEFTERMIRVKDGVVEEDKVKKEM